MILFLDESGVYLLPAIVRTWAPRGQTPVLRHYLTNDHLSVISAISPEGALYFQIQQTAFASGAVIRFLTALHEAIPGKLLIIWDSAPIHRSQEIQAYLAEAVDWLRVEYLPGYAPELNPDEGIWRYLKYVELKNLSRATLNSLEGVVSTALQHIQQMTDIVKSTFRQAKLA